MEYSKMNSYSIDQIPRPKNIGKRTPMPKGYTEAKKKKKDATKRQRKKKKQKKKRKRSKSQGTPKKEVKRKRKINGIIEALAWATHNKHQHIPDKIECSSCKRSAYTTMQIRHKPKCPKRRWREFNQIE